MQDTFLQVFLIAVGLLTYPNSDHNMEDWDDASTAGMQEREEILSREKDQLNQETPLNDHHELQEQETTEEQTIHLETNNDGDETQQHVDDVALTTKNKSPIVSPTRAHQYNHVEETEKPTHTSEANDDYLWIVWKTFSIISLIHFGWKCKHRNSKLQLNKTKASFNLRDYMPLVDSRKLQIFHSRCLQSCSGKKHIEDEFLDGFVRDLLQSMKKVCSENGGMTIGEASLDDLRHVIVPLSPPEPYFFKCSHVNKVDDVFVEMQTCGHIELVENAQTQNGCPCQASDAADEMVCLLHKSFDKMKARPAFDKLLCAKDSKYLSKTEVAKWFKSTLRQAWSLIAFKYEFEVCISNNTPGAVTVGFRSGEKIKFTMNPVIASDNHSYFFIKAYFPNNLDVFWPLSLSKYEDIFLSHVSKRLPVNSCHMQTLEIILFLNKRQTMLTGTSALELLHFKTALMHLLLTKSVSEWRPALLANRLKDMFNFMMYSLKTKQLHHVLIGNPRAQALVQLPANLVKSKPVNLFHPLVVHECIYKNTLLHFQELLRNAQMLIIDYVGTNTPETPLFINGK